MISQFLQSNLASWVAQVFVIATVGASLPVLFRIRHPRTQLAYTHFVLAVCVFIPLIQPWRHAILSPDSHSGVTITYGRLILANGVHIPFGWDRIAWAVLVAGFVFRLGWLAAGLIHIRRYRISSKPLDSIPYSVGLASERVGAKALFCVSPEVRSPATVGFFRPVVLLPESFLSLSPASQHGIACHELLHVRRKDWLVTVIEELLAAVFWFHPGVWWLLAQSRLSREQLVDTEVVTLTSAREDYIASLLAIAGTRIELDLAPAPLFLRRRHLTQRMHLLLTEVSMSKLRLVSSYAAMAAILAAAAWAMVLTFPLEGMAQGISAPPLPSSLAVVLPAPASPIAGTTTAQNVPPPPPPPPPPPSGVVGGRRGGGTQDGNAPPPPPPPPPQGGSNAPIRVGGDVAQSNIVYKVNPQYPPEARQARIEGVLILSVQIAKDGTISDVKIISASNPLLIPGVVDAVRQWVYKPTLLNGEPVEVITTVTINFSLQQ
jgi:protein TonB